MHSCQKEIPLEPVLPQEQTTFDSLFFAHRGRANQMKNIVVQALQKQHRSDGFARTYAADYGLPLWDEDLTVVTDSFTRMLVPVVANGNLNAIWGFEWITGRDSIGQATLDTPPVLVDTAFAWDRNTLFDYFRLKLGMPTERAVRFTEEGPEDAENDTARNNLIMISFCRTVCAYIGCGSYWEFKGCSTYCDITYFKEEIDGGIPIPGGDGGLGGGGNGGNDGTPPDPTYTVTVVAVPANGGTVSGGGVYEKGKSVTITARPNNGFKFDKWVADGYAGTSTSYIITVTKNVTCTAYFSAAPDSDSCGQLDSLQNNTAINNSANSLKDVARQSPNEEAIYQLSDPSGNHRIVRRSGFPDHVKFPSGPGDKYD